MPFQHRWLATIPGAVCYAHLHADRVTLRDVATGRVCEIPSAGNAPGDATDPPRVAPFAHPRLVVHELKAAAQLLKHGLEQLAPKKPMRAGKEIILHPKRDLAADLTDVERRALEELGLATGAKRAYVWLGADLSDEDIRKGLHRKPAVALAQS